MVSLARILKIKKRAKNHSTTILEMLCGKKGGLQKPHIFEKETILKMNKNGDGAKWSVWVKKCQKGEKKDCTTTLELLCAKNRSKNRSKNP